MQLNDYMKMKFKISFTRLLVLFEIILQSLTTWDNGNQLTYPVKYIDPGYKDQNGDSRNKAQEAKSTGFEVLKYDILQR